MQVETTPIDGLLIITPKVFGDERGWFYESYQQEKYAELGLPNFVQDNESYSTKGVLRGLHLQLPPYAQGKLVRVLQGSVLDVAVDLRKESKTYGRHFSIELSADNKKQFYIPPGFAHGFVVLSDEAVFSYKCSNYYHLASERCILWSDADLAIDWGVENPIVSEKDGVGETFREYCGRLVLDQ
jgi:dTDP-4-dehydrorhamnose 3,5-epimerase